MKIWPFNRKPKLLRDYDSKWVYEDIGYVRIKALKIKGICTFTMIQSHSATGFKFNSTTLTLPDIGVYCYPKHLPFNIQEKLSSCTIEEVIKIFKEQK